MLLRVVDFVVVVRLVVYALGIVWVGEIKGYGLWDCWGRVVLGVEWTFEYCLVGLRVCALFWFGIRFCLLFLEGCCLRISWVLLGLVGFDAYRVCYFGLINGLCLCY